MLILVIPEVLSLECSWVCLETSLKWLHVSHNYGRFFDEKEESSAWLSGGLTVDAGVL